MTQPRILVVDDDTGVRESLATVLEYHKFGVSTVASGAAALDFLTQSAADLVFLDVKMPGVDGMEILGRLRADWPDLPIVMISGHGDIRMALDAMRRGAEDFLEKPLDENRLLVVAKNAIKRRSLERENRSLRIELDRELAWHGTGAASQTLTDHASRLARNDAKRILITGESGTGKELLARRIHSESPRRSGPFEVFACGSPAPNLVDDELFGHAEGAFSNATRDHAGIFERARGGTLLLDEVAELPLETQAKLLRVLETGTWMRLGDAVPMQTDACVIATTHHDLAAEARAGTFRQDLYYRLNVSSLHVPPLRERPEDVAPLARAFLLEIARKSHKPVHTLDELAVEVLTSQPWPGNARELRNSLEAMTLLIEGSVLRGDQVQRFFRGQDHDTAKNPFDAPTFSQYRDAADRAYYLRQLVLHANNITKTAESIGIGRTDFHRRLKRLGLRSREKEEPEEGAGPDG